MRNAREILRDYQRDPVYNEKRVTRFVNGLMVDGKLSKAYAIFYEALDVIENKTGNKGYDVWRKALDNCRPSVEVRSRRIGGATFQIPTEVPEHRQISLSLKWIIRYARQRHNDTMQERLAEELIAASNKEGGAIKRKRQTHRMAEANKAFSHFKI